MKLKLITTPMADKQLRRKIENIKKKRMLSKKVVSLTDFRELRKAVESRTILVVDDDEVMRNALKRILESEHYKVIVAEDGLELSKVLETTKLDMILLDVNLPWVNGFELCKLLKDHHTLKHVPLIMVSARNSPEDVEKGFESGADEYITKPFDVEFMTETIQKMFLKATG